MGVPFVAAVPRPGHGQKGTSLVKKELLNIFKLLPDYFCIYKEEYK